MRLSWDCSRAISLRHRLPSPAVKPKLEAMLGLKPRSQAPFASSSAESAVAACAGLFPAFAASCCKHELSVCFTVSWTRITMIIYWLLMMMIGKVAAGLVAEKLLTHTRLV